MYSYTYTYTLPITTGVTKQFFWGVTFHLQTGGAPYCTGFAMNIYIFFGGVKNLSPSWDQKDGTSAVFVMFDVPNISLVPKKWRNLKKKKEKNYISCMDIRLMSWKFPHPPKKTLKSFRKPSIFFGNYLKVLGGFKEDMMNLANPVLFKIEMQRKWWENPCAGTLNNQPHTHVKYSGYLLDIFSLLEGFLGRVKQLGALHPKGTRISL